ncbi:acyl-CoA--sterol O-acyltransferase 1-like [Mercurialis annua]|uniref:acyl-CoA--sterol O-acyltransferase 1-like n=1 Tax=Mercurialis annua TaxID=3986 RepID=UPI00215FFA5C|nr:acyl-CoA--sterol O-acyltransferase 1-like [Mercurialis annua]
MESEFQNFIKVWITVIISLCYSYTIGKYFSKPTKRFVLILPVVSLFLYLPLNLHSPHLGGTTAFFIAWLANFKLLLFCFHKGPLSSDPNISLPLFVAVSCLPIKISKNSSQTTQTHDPKLKNGFVNYAIKGILVAVMVRGYDYSDRMNPNLIPVLYAFHVYFLLEIILAVTAFLARAILGIELEPQFNEPYLSTSLQDFWGHRWNLMVTSILRPTVYEPTRFIFTRFIGRTWATLPAVFGTFVVSAVMHELMFYYLGRVKPTGDISVFFLLHGFCLTAEIALKKALNGRWRLPGLVSGFLTVGFVLTTGFWLFFPKFVQYKIDVKAFEDYAALGAIVKNASESVVHFWKSR